MFSPFPRGFVPPFGPGVATAAATSETVYIQKLIDYSPIAYWPLNEAAGATSVVCKINPLQNGTPTNVTFDATLGPDGENNAPLFNGSSSLVNVYTTTLASVFSGTEGTAGIWAKVLNAGVWEDGTIRWTFDLRTDGNNYTMQGRATTNNRYQIQYTANAEAESNNFDALTSVGWVHYAVRWSDSANKVEYFLNGVETGPEDTPIGTWQGQMTELGGKIGCRNNSTGFWSGWLSHFIVFNTAQSDAVMLGLATV